ncbi:MAG: ATP-binding cassette domain-containing protein [Proteobacteria bacterium]|nr:ATP-binding cassette domain-containing protein [Pseudomonadota bacterium]MBI3499696.1 ATP-binding cassette domain-containing protein [Pseudomonadota bacterium]
MEPTLFRFIYRHSIKDQIVQLSLTLASFPFLYYSLDLPKTIVNRAIGGKAFPVEFLGFRFEQLHYLTVLCGLFLILVIINGIFKYVLNVAKGRMGERMLRRLRYELYAQVLRFPLPHFRRVSQGEIIPMITAETEAVGGFIGDAVAVPVFNGGQLLTIIFFMFVQDPILGAAAVALYPFQGYVIPKLQSVVNQLGKQRVRTRRKIADHVGESISGIQEIHAHDGARYQLARFTGQLATIFDISFEIYQRKFFAKFLNNFINQLTPFFFFSIGGYLVITGGLSLGSLVAVLAAYKDLASPWNELLIYYQAKEDARIKYEQVIEQFQPEGQLDATLQLADPDPAGPLTGEIIASNVTLLEDDGKVVIDGVSFSLPLTQRVAVVGPEGGGKDALAMLIARLVTPNSGQLMLAGRDLSSLPEAVTGRRLAYVGPAAYVFSSSLRDNLLFGLMHRPVTERSYEGAEAARAARRRMEAERTGNILDDLGAAWVDYAEAGCANEAELFQRLRLLLAGTDLDNDVYQIGLRGVIDPKRQPSVAERILEARRALRVNLGSSGIAHMIEGFDENRYNGNATLAENLMFGSPVGQAFDPDKLAANPYVLATLDRAGLTEDLIRSGRKIAETMVELFADLPPDHPFFEQFSFISSEDLPEFQTLLGRVEKLEPADMRPDDRTRLLSLPFKTIVARHRLDVIDESMQERLLAARHLFAEHLPADLAGSIEFFSAERYNAAASLQDNILFGKLAYGQAEAAPRVGAVIGEVLDSLDLRPTVLDVGLEFNVGIGGSRLTPAQRQKVAIGRAMLRHPDLLILNQSTALLDSQSQARIMESVLAETEGRGLIWVLQRAALARGFDRVLVMRGGKLVEQGRPDDLQRPGTALMELVEQD